MSSFNQTNCGHCLRGSQWSLQVYQFNVPTFGPGVVFDVDAKVRAEQFKFFAEALKITNMRGYIPQFVMEAEVCMPFLLLVFGAAE